MQRNRATLIGFSAILMWGLLALLTIGSAPVPPFQMNAVCFGIGGAIGLIWTGFGAGFSVLRRVPLKVYAFGTFGLFGCNFLYFTALRLAPFAETSLIGYLWPLLIVLFSGLLPGEKLGPLHILGAVLAFLGAALIVLQGGAALPVGALPGFAVAFTFAFCWATYSVGSRQFGNQPTEAVTVYLLAASALSLVAHFGLESTVWPDTALGWISVIGLGIGPVGIAFFMWDIGMKRGDIQMLGTLSYAAPLLSTIALVAAGRATATPILGLATLAIAGGAALAARAARRITA